MKIIYYYLIIANFSLSIRYFKNYKILLFTIEISQSYCNIFSWLLRSKGREAS